MLLGDTPATIHFIWRCHNLDFLLDDDAIKPEESVGLTAGRIASRDLWLAG